MQKEVSIKTSRSTELVEITSEIENVVAKAAIRDGICVVYCPHTTAGVTINENADPDVRHDLEKAFSASVPKVRFEHAEGNSPSHYLSCMVGQSTTLVVQDGELVLGRWQGVFLCEFDGPRTRTVVVKLIEG